MTINGNRRFKGDDGKSYFIQGEKGKYYITVLENEFYKICYNFVFDVMYFKTIKDAQREIMFNGLYYTM